MEVEIGKKGEENQAHHGAGYAANNLLEHQNGKCKKYYNYYYMKNIFHDEII